MSKKLIQRLETYYDKHKNKSLYFYPIALLYFKNKEYDKAYQILIEGLKAYPRYALALLLVGKILVMEKNYEAALAYLETAVNIQRNNTQALKLLAECYEKTGKLKLASEIYEKLLLLEDKEEYKSKIVELAGKIKPDEEDLSELVEEISEEKEEIPQIELEEDADDEEEATITMAKLYEKQGYINDAIEIYKKILKKEPDNIEAKESLDRLLKDSGLEGEE